jgi:hypothetical protein
MKHTAWHAVTRSYISIPASESAKLAQVIAALNAPATINQRINFHFVRPGEKDNNIPPSF